ncbi:hypothetical protein DMN91_005164 [Ooceraea biroi]|uniref:THAP domain-containing protein n=1 Tax=Ooceraea biroi TaxID=2015173 RepID=A0A026WY95_OOCBI|nr:uncharacterized protein LOC113561937 [Ooceraea biroi]EZA61040.1 THAP domain-containing protein [Ooceraea biroi]RLU22886.1 hypothetical protein DMN91_005164 [Ooceraea biroi]
MPCCCVIGCHNRAEKGHKLYKLPQGSKNSTRRRQWIENIKRDPLPLHAYVCQDHFTNDQFELRRADHKKLLKWNAVPTVFPHNKTDMNRMPRQTEMVTTALDCNDLSEEIIMENMKLESRVKQEINVRNTRSNGDSDEVAALKSELNSSRKQIRTLKTIISQLQAIIERLVDENYVDEINDPV